MITKRFSKIIALIMIILVFTLTLSATATAIPGKNGSITLYVRNSQTSTPLANTSFKLYFFAKAYENADGIEYRLISPYGEANADISDLQDSYLPIHLTYFAASHSLPFSEKSTDKNGVLVFDNLTPGLYLVVPSQNAENNCKSSPFIISIPEYNYENNQWIYDINAKPKINVDTDIDGNNTYISVVKKWETDKTIPESITVVLLRDFQKYETIQLSNNNNWHYRWDNLPKDHMWNVVETVVPDGYTVCYETSSNTVTIINKSDKKQPATQPDDGKDEDNLIHTGQLNWPVPVFAISGLLLFCIGWSVLNFGKKESE